MTTDNAALNDESEALNSIYGEDTLAFTSSTLSSPTAVLQLPSVPFSFLLSFPADYPDSPPNINGTQSTGASGKGAGEAAVTTLCSVLERIWTPGIVCLFDLIEEASPLLRTPDAQEHNGPPHTAQDILPYDRPASPPSASSQVSPAQATSGTAPHISTLAPANWIHSETLTVSKSTFLARALPTTSLTHATTSIAHLLTTNKKTAAATHNITAWRICAIHPESGLVNTIQDCDDDGETAAGGRLLHLMQVMDVWDCVVVVSRWYGGVKLGAERFRCISTVAREALVRGGFVKEEKKGKGGKKGAG